MLVPTQNDVVDHIPRL